MAEEEFSKVTEEGLKNGAQIGRAWSLVKLENYEKAMPMLKGLSLTPPYSPTEWETQILCGYCYLKTDKGGKGIDHFQELLDTYSHTEDRLDQIIKDEAAIRRYRSILIKEAPLQLTAEEQHYIAGLQNDPIIAIYLKEYAEIQALKTEFLKKIEMPKKFRYRLTTKSRWAKQC